MPHNYPKLLINLSLGLMMTGWGQAGQWGTPADPSILTGESQDCILRL